MKKYSHKDFYYLPTKYTMFLRDGNISPILKEKIELAKKQKNAYRSKYGRKFFGKILYFIQLAKRMYNIKTTNSLRIIARNAFNKGGNKTSNILNFLEGRLDRVLLSSGMSSSLTVCREMIRSGAILVNDKPVTIPSYILESEDLISISEEYPEWKAYTYVEIYKKLSLPLRWKIYSNMINQIASLQEYILHKDSKNYIDYRLIKSKKHFISNFKTNLINNKTIKKNIVSRVLIKKNKKLINFFKSKKYRNLYRKSILFLLKKKPVALSKKKKYNTKTKKTRNSVIIPRLKFNGLTSKFIKLYKKNDLLERPKQLSEFLQSCNTNCSWFINHTLDLMSKDLEFYNYDVITKNIHYNIMANNKTNILKLRRKVVYKDLIYKKKTMLKKTVIKKKTTHFDYVTAKMLLSWKQYKHLYEQVSNFYQKELDWLNTLNNSPIKKQIKGIKKSSILKKKLIRKKYVSKRINRVATSKMKKKSIKTLLLKKLVNNRNEIVDLLTNYYFSLMEKKSLNKKLLYRFNVTQELALTYYTEFNKTEFYPFPLDGFVSGRTIPTKSCYTKFDPSTFTMRFKHDNISLSYKRLGEMLIKSLRY
jgi:ribosomal protein S4